VWEEIRGASEEHALSGLCERAGLAQDIADEVTVGVADGGASVDECAGAERVEAVTVRGADAARE